MLKIALKFTHATLGACRTNSKSSALSCERNGRYIENGPRGHLPTGSEFYMTPAWIGAPYFEYGWCDTQGCDVPTIPWNHGL